MRHLVLILLCLLGFLSVNHDVIISQSEFPPDPLIIFTDYVEDVTVELVESDRDNLQIDNDRQMIHGFFDGEYRQYPYVEGIYGFTRRVYPTWSNIALFAQNADIYWEVWMLNLNTGNWQRYRDYERCDDVSLLELETTNSVIDLLWRLYPAENTDGNTAFHLCASLTGQLTPQLTLPDGFEPFIDGNIPREALGLPMLSNYEYLVFWGYVDDEFHAFSYHFDSQTTRDLGTFSPRDIERISHTWIGFEEFILFSRDSEGCDAYLVDLIQGVSSITTDMANCGSVDYTIDETGYGEAHIVVMNAERESDGRIINCSRDMYYIERGWQISYEYGVLCELEWGVLEGVGYYRELADDLINVDIVRFNPISEEREIIYSGASIEEIKWLSEDERFGIFLFDEYPEVSYIPSSYDDMLRGLFAYLEYVDLVTGEALYRVEIPSLRDNAITYTPSYIDVIEEDLLIVHLIGTSFEPFINTDSWTVNNVDRGAIIVQLDDSQEGYQARELPPIEVILEDRGQIITWNESDNALYLHDISADEDSFTVSLIDWADISNYAVTVSGGADPDVIIVRLREIINGIINTSQIAEYTVRLPAN